MCVIVVVVFCRYWVTRVGVNRLATLVIFFEPHTLHTHTHCNTLHYRTAPPTPFRHSKTDKNNHYKRRAEGRISGARDVTSTLLIRREKHEIREINTTTTTTVVAETHPPGTYFDRSSDCSCRKIHTPISKRTHYPLSISVTKSLISPVRRPETRFRPENSVGLSASPTK